MLLRPVPRLPSATLPPPRLKSPPRIRRLSLSTTASPCSRVSWRRPKLAEATPSPSKFDWPACALFFVARVPFFLGFVSFACVCATTDGSSGGAVVRYLWGICGQFPVSSCCREEGVSRTEGLSLCVVWHLKTTLLFPIFFVLIFGCPCCVCSLSLTSHMKKNMLTRFVLFAP